MNGGADGRSLEIVRAAGHVAGRFTAMGCPCEVLVAGDDERTGRYATSLAAAEAWRIEAKFSRYRRDNLVARINTANGAEVEVDEETGALLDFAARLHALSDGRFDITSGVLRRAWRFDGGDAVPDEAAIAALLPSVGWARVRWRKPTLRMAPGMEIDLGGIGKEYAVDRAALLLRREIPHPCLVNFGGDLVATGVPGSDPSWQVGIEAPDSDGRRAQKRIRLSSGGLATSGDSSRYVMREGKRYGHILDAQTGWPVAGAPRSVTVAADTCTQAGMLATLAMLRGPDAEAFLDREGVRYWSLR